MAKKNGIDVLDMIYNFQKGILNNKPTSTQMYDEIRMMKFKVKPLQGDISLLNLDNTKFIEILWSLGKLDEFFQNHIEKVSPKQRDTFYRLFDEMYQKFQMELNKINLQKEKTNEMASNFEIEIYKERQLRHN
jgi:hypothetical protein